MIKQGHAHTAHTRHAAGLLAQVCRHQISKVRCAPVGRQFERNRDIRPIHLHAVNEAKLDQRLVQFRVEYISNSLVDVFLSDLCVGSAGSGHVTAPSRILPIRAGKIRNPVLINISDQDRSCPVILSAAKNPAVAREILRCAQNDRPDFDWECSLGTCPRRYVIPPGLLMRPGSRPRTRTSTRPPHSLYPSPCPYRTLGRKHPSHSRIQLSTFIRANTTPCPSIPYAREPIEPPGLLRSSSACLDNSSSAIAARAASTSIL